MPARDSARRAMLPVVALAIVALAVLLWPRGRPPLEPGSEAENAAKEAASPPGLLAKAPPMRDAGGAKAGASSPAAEAKPERKTSRISVHVATFDGRDVPVNRVQGKKVDSPAASVEYEGAAGDELDLGFATPPDVSILLYTAVKIPTPVPERLEVRVPAVDDARLADVTIRVLDGKTDAPLPLAVLEPGPGASDLPPLHADGDGRIRVPRATQDRILSSDGWFRGAVLTERSHLPKAWGRLEQSTSAAADWAQWNERGALPVRLDPMEVDVPRTRFRLVDESGRRRVGALVVARYPGAAILPLMFPAPASRTDGNGEVEVLGSTATALDVIEDGAAVATIVVVGGGSSKDPVQELVVPGAIKVRVRVKGLERQPTAWLHGPEPVLAAPEDRTGFARIDGKTLPGWRIFEAFEGGSAAVGDGPPYEIEVVVPRDRDVALDLSVAETSKRVVIHAMEPTTIEVDWATLPAPPKARGNSGWSTTKEGLDEGPGGPKVSPKAKPKDPSKDDSAGR